MWRGINELKFKNLGAGCGTVNKFYAGLGNIVMFGQHFYYVIRCLAIGWGRCCMHTDGAIGLNINPI